MEINIKGIKFDNALETTWLILSLIVPGLLAVLIYDVDLFIKVDIFKLMLGCLSVGVFPVLINFIVWILFSIKISWDTEDDEFFKKCLSMSIMQQNASFLITIVTLVYNKFYLDESKPTLLINVITSYLIVTLLFYTAMILVVLYKMITSR